VRDRETQSPTCETRALPPEICYAQRDGKAKRFSLRMDLRSRMGVLD